MTRRCLVLPFFLMALAAAACAGPASSPTSTLAFTPAAEPTSTLRPRSAVLSELRNEVNARFQAGDAWQPAAEGEQIDAGGGVQTGPGAGARLDTSEGSILRLAENTLFELLELSPQPVDPVTRLRLESGKVWASVAAALGAGSFEVETPTGVATVRGSLMSVDQTGAGGRMLITCLEGTCRLGNPAGAFVDLAAGEQSEIPAAGAGPLPARPMDRSQLDDWLQNFPEAAAIAQALIDRLALEATPTAPPPPAGLNLSATGLAQFPDAAFDAQGNLHVVWEDRSQRPNGDYFYRMRDAAGAWAETENLTGDLALLYGSLALVPQPGGEMCVFWNGAAVATDPGTIGLYRRCRSGQGWQATEFVLAAPGTRRDFSAVISPDGTFQTVYLAGAGDLLFAEQTLSDEGLAIGPALAQDSAGGLHAAWQRLGEPFSVAYRYSGDGGQTWQPIEILSDFSSAPDGLYKLRLTAAADGSVHAAWSGERAFYRRWTPDGGWGPAVSASGEAPGRGPDLAVTADGLARLVWTNAEGAVEYSEQSADGSWEPARTIALAGTNPAIALDGGGGSHVIWLLNGDVFYLGPP